MSVATQQMQQDLRRPAKELRLAWQSLNRAGAFEDDSIMFEETSILDVEEELNGMANDLWIEEILEELSRAAAPSRPRGGIPDHDLEPMR